MNHELRNNVIASEAKQSRVYNWIASSKDLPAGRQAPRNDTLK